MGENENKSTTISELRQAIDTVDEQIVALISQRAELARGIGALKVIDDGVAFVPARERVVLQHVESINKGPLPHEAIRGIFLQIIAASRNLEQPVTVAYLGPEFTFSHHAALLRFGMTSRLVARETIAEVVDTVEHGDAHYGVLPMENSTDGVIRESLDALYRSKLNIADELNVKISHSLWSMGTISEVCTVISHPQPLAQCHNWLRKNLPDVQLQAASSTARAAEIAAENTGFAAICQPMAAERNNLGLLADHIEDSPYNRTRFSIIGPAMSQPSGRDKTSLVFSVKHQAGALNQVLNILEQYGINMTLVESRPTKEMPWQYLFYVDFQGHTSQPNVTAALAEIREHCLFMRILGSYPEAE